MKKIKSQRIILVTTLAVCALIASCDPSNYMNDLTKKTKNLFKQGDITGGINETTNPPGTDADCEQVENVQPPSNSNNSKPINGSSCNREELANEIKSELKENVKPSGGISVSAAVIEVDKNGDQVGEPLVEIQSDKRQRVASSQKIITAYLIYKNRNKIKYPVRLGSHTARMAQSGYTEHIYNDFKNRDLGPKDLLNATLYRSSNTVAFEAMRQITGSSSEKVHAKMINDEVTNLLGANHKTKFSNAHGLDNYNYGYNGGNQNSSNGSTPLEMARLQAKILADTDYLDYLKKYNEFHTNKVGVTKAAGRNYVLISTRKSGNCKGRNYAVFYGGGQKTTARFNPID